MPLIASSKPSSPTASFPHGVKTETLEAGSTIFRIHHQDFHAIWFGPKPGLPPAYRFDAPDGEYLTMYAGATMEGAFVETILHGKAEQQIIGRAFVDQRAWTVLAVDRSLTLMKLYDDGLFWHRTDASISAAQDYVAPRRVALAAFQEHPTLDGLVYRSRHDNGELCFALFDRVAPTVLRPEGKQLFRDHARELDDLMARYGAVYDASAPLPPTS